MRLSAQLCMPLLYAKPSVEPNPIAFLALGFARIPYKLKTVFRRNLMILKRLNRQNLYVLWTVVTIGLFYLLGEQASAQAVVGVINTTIQNMTLILNVIIVGIMAWNGFLLARGDGHAVQKIIYGIIGLIVVNSARLIIEFFWNV